MSQNQQHHQKSRKYGIDWKKDNKVNDCTGCKATFTLFKRKHHCRKCGGIYCHACSTTKLIVKGSKNAKRVCDGCAANFSAKERRNSNLNEASSVAAGEQAGEQKISSIPEDEADSDYEHEQEEEQEEEQEAKTEEAVLTSPVIQANQAKATPEVQVEATAPEVKDEATPTPTPTPTPEVKVDEPESKPVAPVVPDAPVVKVEIPVEIKDETTPTPTPEVKVEEPAVEEPAVVDSDPFAIPEGKQFDVLRKSIAKNKKKMSEVGLESIALCFDMESFLNHESFTSKDSKKKAPVPDAQATVLSKLATHLTNMTGGAAGLGGLSKKSDVAKNETLKRVKRIIVKVDTTNSQVSTVGKPAANWLTITLDEETGDLTSMCNMANVEILASGMDVKLMSAFGTLALKMAVGAAQSELEKKALKKFEATYGRSLDVEFNCGPFENSPEFQALSTTDQTAKIMRIPGCIDAALKAVVKLAKKEDEFKHAFDTRVGRLTFTYDPTSSISYKARNSAVTVKWKAELQSNADGGEGPMTLEITQNLDESRNGLDKVKEVFEPALGIGVDEAELLAAAHLANKLKMDSIKAKQLEKRADKREAAGVRNAERQAVAAEARANDKKEKLEAMANDKARLSERNAAVKKKNEERAARQAAALAATAEGSAERIALEKEQKAKNKELNAQLDQERKANRESVLQARAERGAEAEGRKAERELASAAAREQDKTQKLQNMKEGKQRMADQRAHFEAARAERLERQAAALAATAEGSAERIALEKEQKAKNKELNAQLDQERKAARESVLQARAERQDEAEGRKAERELASAAAREQDKTQKLQNMKDGKQRMADQKAYFQAAKEQRANKQAAAKEAREQAKALYLEGLVQKKQEQAAAKEARHNEIRERRSARQAKANEKAKKLELAAAASIQRAEEAKTAREEKNAEWEQMKTEHDALMAEQKAAKEAGDDAKALKIEQNMKKTEAKREAVRVDNEKAKEHFKMVQAETETKKMAQKQAMASRQADLQARRDAATRQVEAARAARKEKETERLAKHHQQQEEMLRFRNELKQRNETAIQERKARKEEVALANAERKAREEEVALANAERKASQEAAEKARVEAVQIKKKEDAANKMDETAEKNRARQRMEAQNRAVKRRELQAAKEAGDVARIKKIKETMAQEQQAADNQAAADALNANREKTDGEKRANDKAKKLENMAKAKDQSARAAQAKVAAAESKAQRAQDRLNAAEEHAAATSATLAESDANASAQEALHQIEEEERKTESAQVLQFEEETIETGDVFMDGNDKESTNGGAAAVAATSSTTSTSTFGFEAKYLINEPVLMSDMEHMSIETKHQDNADRIAQQWADVAATEDAYLAQLRSAGAGEIISNGNETKDGEKNHYAHGRQRILLKDGGCAFENDSAVTFDAGVYVGMMMKAKYNEHGISGHGYYKYADTFGYCQHFSQLAYHFPTSLETVYPKELKQIWTNDAFVDWATRMTADMTLEALPNPELTFCQPRPLQGLCLKNQRENGFDPAESIPTYSQNNLRDHPVWKYQIRECCATVVNEMKQGIAQCERVMEEAYGIINKSIGDLEAQEKPKGLARGLIAKVIAGLEKDQLKYNKLFKEDQTAKEELKEWESAIVSSSAAFGEATATQEQEEQAKVDNAALVKALAVEIKEIKNALKTAKKAKEDLTELNNDETEAKKRLDAAKLDTKTISNRLKEATKSFNDNKSAVKKAELTVDKLKKKIEQNIPKLDKLRIVPDGDFKKSNKPKGTIDKVFLKIAGIREIMEKNKAILLEEQQKIRDFITRIRIRITGSRDAEIALIVKQHTDVRDRLLADLDLQIARVEAIEKLRRDRVEIHGEKELNRRYQVIKKITQMKCDENDRRDQVNRDCTACGCAVGNKFKAIAHTKLRFSGPAPTHPPGTFDQKAFDEEWEKNMGRLNWSQHDGRVDLAPIFNRLVELHKSNTLISKLKTDALKDQLSSAAPNLKDFKEQIIAHNTRMKWSSQFFDTNSNGRGTAARNAYIATCNYINTAKGTDRPTEPSCSAVRNWLLNPNGNPCPKVEFKTKEPVEHLLTEPPALDGSFWNSKIEKKTSLWKGHTADSIALLKYHADVSFSPYSGWWDGFAGDFYDHGNLIEGKMAAGGSFSAERKNNTVATVYSDVQNDGANSKCKIKPNPPSPYLLYVNKKVGSNIDESSLSWSETRLMWTRTVLQWSPPHQGPNGFVGDRFHYLTRLTKSSGHVWFARIVPEMLAKDVGCFGDGRLGIDFQGGF